MGQPLRFNLLGQRFGRLQITQHVWGSFWRVRCDCGTTKTVKGTWLREGRVVSCGCWNREKPNPNKSHGLSNTPEYEIWQAMRKRCSNPSDKNYPRYGGRGITVAKRWDSFENFWKDMGPRLSAKHSLERSDNGRGYSKANCRWATELEQAANRRGLRHVTRSGMRLHIAEWCRRLKLHPMAVYQRVYRGMTPGRALNAALKAPRCPAT